MKLNKLLFAIGLTLGLTANASASEVAPPDSTSTIVQRTAAALIIEEGKTLYFEGRTKDALIKFREAAQKDKLNWKAPFWISRCHYDMNNYGYALKYANEAVLLDKNEIDKYVYDLLGDSYHRLGSLDSAIINYELAISLMSKARANEYQLPLRLAQAKFAKTQIESGVKPARVRCEGNVNSGYDDYAPVVTNGGKTMYFTSRRSNTTGGGLNPSDQSFFEDIYVAKWDPDFGEWDSISNELGRLNSNGFESLSYISDAGDYAIISLNTEADPDAKIATQSTDLCEIKFANGKWSSPKKIKVKTISSSYYDGNATVTADGNTMYFISEQDGEKSMSDIYVSERVGKKWGPAKKLPMTVNSEGRETTPYITPDGKYLFFSSNGRADGMGGYDVYVCEKTAEGWSDPVNLGAKVNSVNDDTHFQYYEALGKAYFSSINLVGDKASRDIFELAFTIAEVLGN